MKAFAPLWKREMAAYVRTPIGYVVGAFFLLVTGGTFAWRVSSLAHGAGQESFVQALFTSPGYWLAMLIATPLLTMRLFAEERRLNTLEGLLAAPVTETEVVLAKFAAAQAGFLLLWIPTLLYPLCLRACGIDVPPLDPGAAAAGYFGTALVGASFLALGLLCSLLTRHQMVAAMGCLALLGLLLAVGWLPLPAHADWIRRLAPLISAPLQLQDFAAGIVDTRAVVWHVCVCALLLFSSIRILEARRLR